MEPTSDPAPVPSRQEMFDRAWRGLKAQGWRRAVNAATGKCAYLASDGCRCAWGHVDPEGTAPVTGSVSVIGLRDTGIGLAARLSEADAHFAHSLQAAHDDTSSESLEQAMRAFAAKRKLTIPEERVVYPTTPAPTPSRDLIGLLGSGRYPLTCVHLVAEARGDVDLQTDVGEIVRDVRAGLEYTEVGFSYAAGVEFPIAEAAEKLFTIAMQRAALWAGEP